VAVGSALIKMVLSAFTCPKATPPRDDFPVPPLATGARAVVED
jgi:hypothetical protein